MLIYQNILRLHILVNDLRKSRVHMSKSACNVFIEKKSLKLHRGSFLPSIVRFTISNPQFNPPGIGFSFLDRSAEISARTELHYECRRRSTNGNELHNVRMARDITKDQKLYKKWSNFVVVVVITS